MAVDYAQALATARRLVQENGRQVTFVKLDKTPADAQKPWRGATDPRSPADDEVVANVVMVPPASASKMGLTTESSDLVLRSQRIYIVAPPAGGENLAEYDEVADESPDERWGVVASETLRPADTTLLYLVGVAR